MPNVLHMQHADDRLHFDIHLGLPSAYVVAPLNHSLVEHLCAYLNLVHMRSVLVSTISTSDILRQVADACCNRQAGGFVVIRTTIAPGRSWSGIRNGVTRVYYHTFERQSTTMAFRSI